MPLCAFRARTVTKKGEPMALGSRWDRLTRSEAFNGYVLVSPTAIYAILMLAAPLATIVAYSFFKDGYLTIIREFTLENYITTWTDPVFRAVMLRSLMVSAMVTAATVLLAFPIAYYVSFHVPASRKARWLFLITIPFWTSYLIRVFLWKVILGYNGVINSGLMNLGLIDEPLTFILYNVNSIVLTLAHAYAPFAILPIFVALEKIDRALLEAGQDLGESRLMTFWRVTLPLAMPGVVAAVLIVFIPTIGDYVTPQLIGGGKIPMVANLIQARMLDLDNKPMGSAIAVSAMAIVTLVSLIFLFMNRRFLRGQR
ncbi:spermidine/putrescine transport system permease protein [Phaeovulum veldkampii DSM 11550]|nr:spermidine/putrescine transport system permease protein [Phaeovulum veldkampii DSM 11550]